MASITYDSKSDQLTQVDGNEDVFLSPKDLGARVRMAKVSYTTETGNLDSDDADVHIELARLPANAEVIGGYLAWETLSTATTGTMNIGTTEISAPEDGSDNNVASALDITAAGSQILPEAATVSALTHTEPFAVFAQLTTDDADLTVDKDIYGYVLYVVNS